MPQRRTPASRRRTVFAGNWTRALRTTPKPEVQPQREPEFPVQVRRIKPAEPR